MARVAPWTNYTSPGYAGGYGYGWRIGHNTLTNWAAFHTGNLAGTATLWVRGNKGVHGVILCNSRSYDSYFDTAMYVLLNDIMTRVRQLY